MRRKVGAGREAIMARNTKPMQPGDTEICTTIVRSQQEE
jgi:hypothetical protein